MLGCREKLIPPPSHQGRVLARHHPPPPGAHSGWARTTRGGDPFGVGREGAQETPAVLLLTSFLSNPGSPPPIPNLHPAPSSHSDHISATVMPRLRDARRLSPSGIPQPPGALQARELGTIRVWLQGSRGCLPPQSLPNSLRLRVGLEGMGSSKLEATGLGAFPVPTPLTCQGPARLQRLLGNRSTRTGWERPVC